jgi:hypothetical protein
METRRNAHVPHRNSISETAGTMGFTISARLRAWRFGGAQARSGAGFIWDFYKDVVAHVSKSYAAGGTSCAIRRGKPSLRDLTRGDDGARLGVSTVRASSGANKMMDVIMLAIGLGFFVLSVGYCYACDRL